MNSRFSRVLRRVSFITLSAVVGGIGSTHAAMQGVFAGLGNVAGAALNSFMPSMMQGMNSMMNGMGMMSPYAGMGMGGMNGMGLYGMGGMNGMGMSGMGMGSMNGMGMMSPYAGMGMGGMTGMGMSGMGMMNPMLAMQTAMMLMNLPSSISQTQGTANQIISKIKDNDRYHMVLALCNGLFTLAAAVAIGAMANNQNSQTMTQYMNQLVQMKQQQKNAMSSGTGYAYSNGQLVQMQGVPAGYIYMNGQLFPANGVGTTAGIGTAIPAVSGVAGVQPTIGSVLGSALTTLGVPTTTTTTPATTTTTTSTSSSSRRSR